MPTLRFYHIAKSDVIKCAPALLEQLGEVLALPQDYINLDVIESVAVTAEGVTTGLPMVEVLAFERAAELEGAVAGIVTTELEALGYNEIELYFIYLTPTSYYCSAVPCE